VGRGEVKRQEVAGFGDIERRGVAGRSETPGPAIELGLLFGYPGFGVYVLCKVDGRTMDEYSRSAVVESPARRMRAIGARRRNER
jgi:hypothetical protein